MKITEDEVRYVAELANLTLTDEEVRKFGAELDEILEHIDKLNAVDTSGVEPMTCPPAPIASSRNGDAAPSVAAGANRPRLTEATCAPSDVMKPRTMSPGRAAATWARLDSSRAPRL